ncbi:hypothetical protein Q0Z83_037030 [Actinoplanes sichuanensis]|uniref:Uncharacterized protein n=1 Tax=Actinoplanes sichuanensis TaxID=512349 RepID=A0ABW4A3I6_9ACTN|nr:hypothetical protein [Actinoplanes sichuanensis]BEL05512.1 hypothetical protein Q0Z83_037030 [Actinoplanes sichuanensis]
MTASFERWELMTRTALGDRGIGYREATPLIQQARSDYEQSGADPWQALGSPDDFAADVAAAQPAVQARLDTQGKTPRDHLSDGLFVLAFVGVPASLLAMWVNGGLTIPLTVAGVVGTVLVGLSLFVCIAAPSALRASGHPRLAPWGFVGAGLLVIAAGVAFTRLPTDRIGETSALGTLVVSLGLGWLLTRPGRPAEPSTGSDPADPEAWFARLQALLVGRFDLPADRAAVLVEEARAHVTEAGSSPGAEFPSLEQFAQDLAAGEPRRQVPWWRTRAASTAGRIALLVLMAVLIVSAVLDGDWWIAVTGAALPAWVGVDFGRRADS